MSRGKAAILGSMSSQIFMIIIMLGGLVITPLLLNYLDKEEYGLVTVVLQLIGYINLFDFGLGTAVSRNLAAHRNDDEDSRMMVNKIISTSFYTYTIIGVLISLLVLSFAPFVPSIFKTYSHLQEAAIALTLSLGISVSVQFPLKALFAIFYAHQKQLISNTVGFIVTFLNLTLPLLFLHLGFELWSFVYTNLACSFINIVAVIILYRRYYAYVKIKPRFFDKVLLKGMFQYGFFLFLNGLAYQVIFFTDRFFIGSLVSLSAVSIFSVTAKAPEFSRELIFRITDNVFPALVEINTKEGEKTLKVIHQKLLSVTTCLFTIAAWMIGILNYSFVSLWVGADFYAGHTIFFLALVLLIQHTLIRISGICLIGADLVKGFSIMAMVEAVINIALTIMLGKQMGVTGILLATILAGALTNMWYVPHTAMKYMNISVSEYLRTIFTPLLTISALGGVLFWVAQRVWASVALTWLNFFLIAFVLALVFGCFAWLLFLRNEFSAYIPPRIKKYLYVTQ